MSNSYKTSSPKRLKMSEPGEFSFPVETCENMENCDAQNEVQSARQLLTRYSDEEYLMLPEAENLEEFLQNPSQRRPKPDFLTMLYSEDDTVLTHVVKHQNIEAVAAFVRAGVDTNLPNRKGITPISANAYKENGNIAIMQLLIEGGALVNALNSSDRCSTALIQVFYINANIFLNRVSKILHIKGFTFWPC